LQARQIGRGDRISGIGFRQRAAVFQRAKIAAGDDDRIGQQVRQRAYLGECVEILVAYDQRLRIRLVQDDVELFAATGGFP